MRVLLVDDEKIERQGLKYLFDKHGFNFEIHEAKHGEIALEKLKEQEFDLVITDLKMPVMDGLHLIENMHDLEKIPRTVIYSAYSDFFYAKQAIHLGVIDYLIKPVEEHEFVKLITRVENEISIEKTANLEKILGSSLSQRNEYGLELSADDYNTELRGIAVAFDIEASTLGQVHEAFKEILETVFPEVYLFIENEQEGIFFALNVHKNVYESLQKLIPVLEEKVSGYVRFFIFESFTNYEKLKESVCNGKNKLKSRIFAPRSQVYSLLTKPDENEIYLNRNSVMHNVQQDDSTVAETLEKMIDELAKLGQFSNLYTKYIFLQMIEKVNPNLSPKDIEKFLALENLEEIEAFLYEIIGVASDRNTTNVWKEGEELTNSNSEDDIDDIVPEVETVKTYIKQHFQDNPNLDTIAQQVHLSPNYLCVVFKKETGMTVIAYMTEVKLNYAAYLLENTYERIADIGEKVGYTNTSYFNMIFKNSFGMTPSVYRKQKQVNSMEK